MASKNNSNGQTNLSYIVFKGPCIKEDVGAFCKLFDICDFTMGLQSPSISITECLDLIEGLKDSFSTFRDNSKGDFDKIVKVTDDLMVKNEIYDWDVSYQFPKQKTASKVCWTRMLHLKWEKQPRLGTTCVYRHNGTRYWTSNLWNSVVFRTSHTG